MRMIFRTMALCLFLVWTGKSNAEYKCFYGNLHAHTGYSDGESTPDTAFAYARDVAGIDVQALTDHNNYTDYSISPSEYQNLRLVADTFSVAGRFLALAGQEIGRWSSSGYGHINIFDAPVLLSYNFGDLLGTYRLIATLGRPAMFNHPTPGSDDCPNFNNLCYYQDYSQAMDLLELMNSDYIYENAYLLALNNGWHVGASANQDNHDRDWGDRVNSSGNIPLTGIWADTLTKAAVLEALQSRRTTAMEVSPAADRIELLLSVDGRYQGEHFIKRDSVASISVQAKAATAFKKVYLYIDGSINDSLVLLSAADQLEWECEKNLGLGTHYLFVKAVQSDNDRAWTSPVYIEIVGNKSQVTTWPAPVKNNALIMFTPLAGAVSAKATIYDLSGANIREITGDRPDQPINWNGKDRKGRLVPNGIYIIRLELKTSTETRTYLGKTMVSR